MGKKFTYVDLYGDATEVQLELNMYRDNNNLYLGMTEWDEELQGYVHYGDVTVNIHDLPYLQSTIDTNNFSNALIGFLVENNIAEGTGRAFRSGYCIFPIFEFNADVLKEIDPEVFAAYQKAHGIEVDANLGIGSMAENAMEAAEDNDPRYEADRSEPER